jgi:hypothetical protein
MGDKMVSHNIEPRRVFLFLPHPTRRKIQTFVNRKYSRSEEFC